MALASLWRRRGSAAGRVGVAWSRGQLALVHFEETGEGPSLAACSVVADTPEALRGWVQDRSLAGARCALVPPEEECVLRVVEAPEVPDEERRDSARWLVQDLLDFPAEDAWIDVLEIPVDEGWTRARKLGVVAGHGPLLRERAQQIRRAGLVPDGFEVRERALLALADPGRDLAGVAVLDLRPKASLLVVGERGELHVTRPLAVDAESMGDDAAAEWDESGEPEAPADAVAPAFESLLLELQRSLDYVESEYGRSPIRRVVVSPTASELSALGPYFEHHLRLEVEFLDLTRSFPGDAAPSAAEQGGCLAAAGGAIGPGDLFVQDLTPRRPPRAGLCLRSLAQMSAAVAAFGVLQLGVDQLQARSLRGELAGLENAHAATRARFTELSSRVKQAETDPARQARVDTLEAQRRGQATLLEQLEGSGGPPRAFAPLLAALASQPVEGLWLTGIQLRDEGRALTLEGAALTPEHLPRLLARLRREPALAGVQFASVQISRPEDEPGWIEFALESQAPGSESGP